MMGLTLKGQESMWYAFSWIQAWFPPLEENDEVVPGERSLPVVSTHMHLFEPVLFTQLSLWHLKNWGMGWSKVTQIAMSNWLGIVLYY